MKKRPNTISRQIAVSFAVISIVSVAMCVVLVGQLFRAGASVENMRHDEDAIRESTELAIAIREQYVHLAHTLIVGDDSHEDHYQEWRTEISQLTSSLRHHVPVDQEWRLREILVASDRVEELFRSELHAAWASGDLQAIRRAHEKVDAVVAGASEHADFLARFVEDRMAGDHTVANRATEIGFAAGMGCALTVIFLSSWFTMRLRQSVMQPLDSLALAASQLGAGQFDTRLGDIGEGELQAVATAFDRMADELAERERKLVEAERMAVLGQLAAGIAHELNNPIGIIRGYLKMMDPTGDIDTLKEELAILDEEASACQRIADDLLAYSQTPSLARTNIEMQALLRDTVDRMTDAQQFPDHPLTVSAEKGFAYIDPARVRQVVINLLNNAAQLSPNGTTIELEGRVIDTGYEISVADRGPSVSIEKRERIFEPFYTERPGGSGLGLAVCQGIVRSHGGEISVVTRQGGGSRFMVQIPSFDASTSSALAISPDEIRT